MAMGIHEICLAGTCCYCRQAIKLRGMSGGGLGPQWDGGWQADPEPGDRSAWAGYCVARTDLAAARGRTATGLGHRPARASIQVRSAHDEPVAEAEGIGVTRYAVMQKPPVSLFFPAGLLITGVPAGIELEEVQAELDAVLRRGRGGAVGFFADDPEARPAPRDRRRERVPVRGDPRRPGPGRRLGTAGGRRPRPPGAYPVRLAGPAHRRAGAPCPQGTSPPDGSGRPQTPDPGTELVLSWPTG